MVYNTQIDWVFGLFTSSGTLENKNHDASETGSVSVLRWGGKTTTQLGPLWRANLNQSTTLSDFFSYLIAWDQANSAGDNVSFSILVLRICVRYHSFYCIFSCHLLPN
jgi:hypothetical protein